MHVGTITSKTQWERFLTQKPEANFLASWNWGQFHKSLGKQVFYLGFFKKEQLLGVCLLVKEKAKRGNYLTVAGGPIIDWSDSDVVSLCFKHIEQLSREQRCLFVRIRPQILDTQTNRDLASSLHLIPSPMHLTADLTLQLSLDKTPDDLLVAMRKSTRYEIKRASKLGITTRLSKDPQEIKQFTEHQNFLAEKHGFIPFSYSFLLEQFKTFVLDDQAALIHAYAKNQLLATAYVLFYGKEAVYHYGISTPENQKLPGAYACQWTAINEAKKRGMLRYNFWGIAPVEASPHHRFAGVSLFKRGFGGQEVAYLPAHDLVTSPWYYAVKIFETARAKARRLS